MLPSVTHVLLRPHKFSLTIVSRFESRSWNTFSTYLVYIVCLFLVVWLPFYVCEMMMRQLLFRMIYLKWFNFDSFFYCLHPPSACSQSTSYFCLLNLFSHKFLDTCLVLICWLVRCFVFAWGWSFFSFDSGVSFSCD